MKISVIDIRNTVKYLSGVIIRNEVPFCELDSVAGDGDFGMSLSKGFKQVLEDMEQYSTEDIGAFIDDCAMTIYEYCGGASGPIWGSAFKAAGQYAKGKMELSGAELGEMMENAVDGIQKKGGAVLGDKTLLDALIPAVKAYITAIARGASLRHALDEAARSAADGAENTRLIAAKKGRATYLGERSIHYPDAGAMAVSIILREMLDEEDRMPYKEPS